MKTFDARFVAGAAIALLLGSSGAVAGSLAASSAAGGSSASSASSAGSDSSGKSSDSSSKKNTAAAGPYRIVAVAALPDQPDKVRMKLQSLTDAGDAGEYFLYLPRQIVSERGLLVGGTVLATPRPYGTEFASADTHQAIFLLMHDDWFRELAANPLVL